jgi:hypothetical protein
MGGVVHHVLEQGFQRYAKADSRGIPVAHRSREVRLREAIDEGSLLGLQEIPLGPEVAHGRKIGVARQAGGRRALPPRQPDRVGSIDMGEHPLDGGSAPLPPHLAGERRLAQVCRHVEESTIRPAMIVVEAADQLAPHVAS